MSEQAAKSLWRHGDFMKLWAGQTISHIGSQISFLALPLLAVVMLEAMPVQMGILTAIESVPRRLERAGRLWEHIADGCASTSAIRNCGRSPTAAA